MVLPIKLTFPPGPSSNIAFLRHISLALPQVSERFETRDMNIATSSTTADWMHVSRPQAALTGITITQLGDKVNIYALPPEARTWQLISEYFQKTGQLLPFIHEQSFCDTYFEMKHTGFTMARRTWLGLLNIILAMACTLTVDGYATAEERIAESDVYYQRANCLCERESRRNISLELGEILLPILYGVMRRTMLIKSLSSILAFGWAVPSRHAEVCSSMDCPWLSHFHRLSIGLTLPKDEPGLSSC